MTTKTKNILLAIGSLCATLAVAVALFGVVQHCAGVSVSTQTVEAQGQFTGGTSRVWTLDGGICSGAGKFSDPINCAITTSSPVTGTGSAGSPLSATVVTDSTITGTGSAGSPLSATATQTTIINGLEAALFGDGTDGDGAMDGVTTPVGCATLSGSTYTASRDCFFDDLDIDAGVTFKPDCYRVYVRGTLINDGTIHANGGSGSGTTGGTSGCPTSRPLNATNFVGGAGNTNGGGAGGTASTAAPRGFSTAAAAGGTSPGTGATTSAQNGASGGAGHGGGSGAAGSNLGVTAGAAGNVGGTVTLMTAAQGDIHAYRAALESVNIAGTRFTLGSSGAGGGGRTGHAGGGGGGSGGWVFVAARTFSGAGTFEAQGGTGANGAGDSGGGGGGGAGGIIVITIGYGSVPSTSVVGGSGGTGASGSGGNQPGGNGGNGGNGLVISYRLSN